MIPENSTKVFDGIISEVYQRQEKKYDGTIGTYELVKGKLGTVVIGTTESKKILVTKETQPGVGEYFSLPGGRVDNNSPLENALHELEGETGYTSTEIELFAIHTGYGRIRDNRQKWVAKNR